MERDGVRHSGHLRFIGVPVTDTSTTVRFAALLTVANGFIDPYTVLTRGGVFANVQTGNVIFSGVALSVGHWGRAAQHLCLVVVFVLGVTLAAHLKKGGLAPIVSNPLRWTLAVQVIVLGISGLVPMSAPQSYVTVPISLLAGMQVGLFRQIGNVGYFPVGTTGNLVRFGQSGHDYLIERRAEAREGFLIYCWLIPSFACGAITGAFVTRAVGVRGIWVAAALMAFLLVLLELEHRKEARP
jgi:uncharacterized membrane protein YoaK (UPF0700 family)